MGTITLSCTTCCLRNRGRDEIQETLAYAPCAGYTYMGLAGPLTWEPGLIQWLDRDRFAAALRAAGLGLSEIWSPPIPTDSEASARRGAENLGFLAQACVDLGCPRLVQTGGPRVAGGLKQTILGLRLLAECIAGTEVRICLESHLGSQIRDLSDYDEILAGVGSPQVGITVDTGHLHAAGADMFALIRRYPDRVWNVHLKDHVGAQSVPIGTGEIDLRGLVRALREIDYEGFFAVELEVTDPENAVEYIKHAFDYLTGLLAS
jgi:sugar phosphate isomerase/epimerase